ncbi:SH3 domain-containing protein [Neosynechococcus sphagnicola]|uniref:SH3 domain-containing protein n=1 Tax=Neosynechococcus sphagnicola TaxID=1501145 RepID=UPI00138E304E|nr:SH3 domain-containing protein [Neosynechococcus sphagnicola]
MKYWFALPLTGALMASAVRAEQPLFVAYPPPHHQTTAAQIFLIGSAPPGGQVLVNGIPIPRSAAGYFAPSFPLQVGKNLFRVQYQQQQIEIQVLRQPTTPVIPTGVNFGKDSLQPAVKMARLPGELLCFSAIAPDHGSVSLKLSGKTIPLQPVNQTVELPPNAALLTQQNQPIVQTATTYAGCMTAISPGDLGHPMFQLTLNGTTLEQPGVGAVEILAADRLPVIAVTVESGTARTGPGSDFSRLTPLPQGTEATVTGWEGEWLRLDYGGWIRQSEVKAVSTPSPVRSRIRSITSRQVPGWTEVSFSPGSGSSPGGQTGCRELYPDALQHHRSDRHHQAGGRSRD